MTSTLTSFAGLAIHARVRETSAPPKQTVLMLHGNPDDHALWDKVVGHLPNDIRTIAPDLPGYGLSEYKKGFDWSLNSMAAFPKALLESHEVAHPITLIVHDFGGPFGLAFASRFPGLIRRIIITNTIFHADYEWHLWAKIWRTRWLGEISTKIIPYFLFAHELKRGSAGNLSKETIARNYDHFTKRRITRRAMLDMYRQTPPKNFVPWQEQFHQAANDLDIVVLWGERDPYIPGRFADGFHSADVRKLPDIGHWVPLEAPDLVADAILKGV